MLQKYRIGVRVIIFSKQDFLFLEGTNTGFCVLNAQNLDFYVFKTQNLHF